MIYCAGRKKKQKNLVLQGEEAQISKGFCHIGAKLMKRRRGDFLISLKMMRPFSALIFFFLKGFSAAKKKNLCEEEERVLRGHVGNMMMEIGCYCVKGAYDPVREELCRLERTLAAAAEEIQRIGEVLRRKALPAPVPKSCGLYRPQRDFTESA